MAKDPAILWYWDNWHSGTCLLNRHEKGCYMDLLHAQFQNGPLTLDQIKKILGQDFDSAWSTLVAKFDVTEDGKYFNKRLHEEKEKRRKFTESRRLNVSKRYICSSSVDTTKIHMGNGNGNINGNMKEGVQGEKTASPTVDDIGVANAIISKILAVHPGVKLNTKVEAEAVYWMRLSGIDPRQMLKVLSIGLADQFWVKKISCAADIQKFWNKLSALSGTAYRTPKKKSVFVGYGCRNCKSKVNEISGPCPKCGSIDIVMLMNEVQESG